MFQLYQGYVYILLCFNVPPTAKVIWRWGHGLKSHPTDWWSWESSLSTPQRLLVYILVPALNLFTVSLTIHPFKLNELSYNYQWWPITWLWPRLAEYVNTCMLYQGSYSRQVYVKLKDFSRTFKRLCYPFQGLKTCKNTDLHVEILLWKC